MSGLVNKIKEAVHGDKHHDSSADPASSKGHSSHAANKADPRIDSDRDNRANPATGATGSVGHTGTTGTHGSSTLGGDSYNTTGTSGLNTSTNRGPHDSNLANKADPRVDSDRDHRANPASNVGGTGNVGAGEFGSSRTTGNEFGSSGVGSTGRTTRSGAEYGSSGPTGIDNVHNTTTGAKLDPRVDSSNIGSHSHGTTGTHGTTGLGSSNTYGTSTNAGPHDSNLANKADPRVDSDRDHRGAYGTTGATGTSGLGSSNTYGNTSTNAGPHDSNMMNKADPRVDSDRDHRANPASNVGGTHGTTGAHGTHGATSGLTSGPGPAPNTAGPHKSDMMNKVDPRVDSDRDGSKTIGQDQTYARSNVNKDPTDAAQVPPSVLAKHIGEPSVEHGDHGHDRARRNSTHTHQEAHRGL